MQTLGLNDENSIETPKRFWRRQFQDEQTRSQNKFDWAFGVIIPVICFFFDPIVFTEQSGGALLGTYKPFAYLLSFGLIMTMMAWLLWGAKLKWANSLLAGLFTIGSLVSLIIGIILAPFSLIGLIVLIGALGFTPFFTSFVYLRSSVRAFRASLPFLDPGMAARSFALSAIFSAVVPYVVNVEITYLVMEMATADARTIQRSAAKLKFVSPLVNLGPVADRYYRSSDDERRSPRMQSMAEAYEELTGKPITSGISAFAD